MTLKKIALADAHVPTDAFNIVRLTANTKAHGIIFPQRNDQEPMFVSGDGNSLQVIPLTGAMAFRHFRMSVGSSQRGLFFEDVQFRVNIGSIYNPISEDCLGTIIIEEGKLKVTARLSSDSHGEPLLIEVGDVPTAAEQEWSTGFKDWSIVKTINGQLIELYNNGGNVTVLDT